MNYNNFIAIGTSHKEMTLEEREKFLKLKPLKTIEKLFSQGKIQGYINLSTCLRAEFYLHLSEKNSVDEVINELKEFKLFLKQGHEGLNYLFRVACGFESVIKGEDQILAQLKKSHATAMEEKHTTNVLNVIFNKASELGKKFRHNSKIGHNALSLEGISLKFIKAHVDTLEDKKILILGLGDLSESIMKLLLKEKLGKITVTNRSRRKSLEIQRNYPVDLIGFEDKISAAAEHDIIISATSAPHYVVHENEFSEKMDSGKKYIFLDLAVPRDIDEGLTKYENISLYNLDDVWSVYHDNLGNREVLLKKYEYMILEQLESLEKWFKYRRINGK